MGAHDARPAADLAVREFQERLWSIAYPGRRWPLRVRLLAWLRRSGLDSALVAGADPSSALLERRAALLLSRDNRAKLVGALRQSRASAGGRIDPGDVRAPVDPTEVEVALRGLIELEDLLISPTPVYCRGVVLASRIVADGTGPLYAPRRRGELRERVGGALAALRGAI